MMTGKLLVCLCLLLGTCWSENNPASAGLVRMPRGFLARVSQTNSTDHSMMAPENAEEILSVAMSKMSIPDTENRLSADDRKIKEKMLLARWTSSIKGKEDSEKKKNKKTKILRNKMKSKKNGKNKKGKTNKKNNKKKGGKKTPNVNQKNNTNVEGDLFEGDMILNEKQLVWLQGSDTTGTTRNALKNFRWPNGIVYYSIDSSVSRKNPSYPSLIRSTLANLQKKLSGCIKFQERRTGKHVNVVNFIQSAVSCHSSVGYQGRVQLLELGEDLSQGRTCYTARIIEHEFLHAIGIYHEQSRSDRDQHVTILDGTNGKVNNIEPGKEGIFRSYPQSIISHFGLPYDYYSVMHYGKTAFGIKDSNGRRKTTIVTKDPTKQDVIGKNTGVSSGDIELIRRFYECDKGTSDCQPAPNTWSDDCSAYTWACTDSSYPWYKEVCSTTCNYCVPSDQCQPSADTWNGDCSAYKWACTHSSYPWYKEVCSTTCDYCVSSGQCQPAANTWNHDCSEYKWACTDSRYPWYKEVCSTTCKYCP